MRFKWRVSTFIGCTGFYASALSAWRTFGGKGDKRILLVMATATGKTYTAFQIIWRLWKSRTVRRVLFLVVRNILADQTMTDDFKPFGAGMTKVKSRMVEKSHEIYLALYQAITGTEEDANIYRQSSPNFFDLIALRRWPRQIA
jgi:type I restriction enzyme R subunit